MVTIKTETEIQYLREGGRRHAAILSTLAAMVAPGVTGRAIDKAGFDLIREGMDTPAFLNYRPEGASFPYPASVCLSVNNEIVHGIPSDRPFVEGDIVSIDIGLIHKKMVTDAAVTVMVGKVSSEAKRLVAATYEALVAGIAVARGGGRVGDIGAAIEAVADKHQFSLAEGLAGHGVGYAVHEDPYIPNTGNSGDGPLLKPGMVIAIEPMLVTGSGAIELLSDGYTFCTADGGLAAHFEHTVVITKGDALILTQV